MPPKRLWKQKSRPEFLWEIFAPLPRRGFLFARFHAILKPNTAILVEEVPTLLTIKQYVRAQSLDEAYTLCQKRANVVLGGMLWLKTQNRTVDTAIDLSDLALDTIEETPDEFRIGAMVTLRQLEQNPNLAAYTRGAMAESIRHIVGVQFRNLATVGGSIYGRFGFSDVLTLFLALDAAVELHHGGRVPLAEYAARPYERDILTHIVVPKQPGTVAYLAQRNVSTDFPVLTCAVAVRQDGVRCAIGARPMKAQLYQGDPALLAGGITPETAEDFAGSVAAEAAFGSNLRAGADYRRAICKVLVRRALLACKEDA